MGEEVDVGEGLRFSGVELSELVSRLTKVDSREMVSTCKGDEDGRVVVEGVAEGDMHLLRGRAFTLKLRLSTHLESVRLARRANILLTHDLSRLEDHFTTTMDRLEF